MKEGGLPALTLRACAARAGVSHAAPAHHFDGLPGLLAAIAAQGFGVFAETMIKERGEMGPAPYHGLLGICRGYLIFAQKNPAMFTLMFDAEMDITDDSVLMENANAAYGVLTTACAPFEPLDAGAGGLEMMVWSLVHGFANLQLSGRLGPRNAPVRSMNFEDILPELTLRNSS